MTDSTQTSIAIAWNASSDAVGVKSYRLYRNGAAISTTTALTATFGGLTCGLSYTFGVEALDAAGNKSDQALVTRRTADCPAGGTSDTVAPSVPVGLVATTATASSISLMWTASFDNVGVAGYDVLSNGSKVGVAGVPTYTIFGLNCGTSYSIAIAAFDAAGNRSQQAKLSTSTGACSAPTPPPPPPPPPGGGGACTQTISSGLQSALQSASPGSTICLSAGSYGNVSLASVSKASTVTVQPASGASVSLGELTLSRVDHLRFTGSGGSMRIGGLDLDGPEVGGWSHDLTFEHATWTSGATVRTRGTNQAIVLDNNVFDGLAGALYEGRVSVRGYDNSSAVGVTISNNHFGGGGCSDGVQVVGNANGVQIGPGNEFTGIQQSGCAAHADPIQFYGAVNTVVTGNFFHDNGDGTGGLASFDGDDPATVTNNVFVCTCDYPWSVAAFAAQGWVIRHNTFAHGGNLRFQSGGGGHHAYDNVWAGGGGISCDTSCSSYGTNDHNLNSKQTGTGNVTGNPVFVGGANPTTYDGFRLATGSPGKGAASDGSDMGIN